MKYQLQISGSDAVIIDESTAVKIKAALLSGDKERFVEVGKNLIRMSQIKMVTRLDEGSEAERQKAAEVERKVAEFREKLAKYALETPKHKAEREVRVRIKYGLEPVKATPLFPYEDIVEFLTEWFEKHPDYPWCPFREYKSLVFGMTSSVPLFFKKVLLHDDRVEEWMELNEKAVVKRQEPTPQEVFDGQAPTDMSTVPKSLEEVLKGGD